MTQGLLSQRGRAVSTPAAARDKGTIRPPVLLSGRLLDQRAGVGSSQRYDRVEISDVPAFLQHVDVNDDFGGFIGVLDLEQPLDHLVCLGAPLARVDLDDLCRVAPLEEAHSSAVDGMGARTSPCLSSQFLIENSVVPWGQVKPNGTVINDGEKPPGNSRFSNRCQHGSHKNYWISAGFSRWQPWQP